MCHIAPFADKITAKLASWKVNCLSMAGRLTLGKYIILSMTMYSINIYNWPVATIKRVKRAYRNFIRSRCTSKRVLCVVSWNKVCQPLSKGGLGPRFLVHLNEATNLKLLWDIFNSNEGWATLLKNRIIRPYGLIRYHIFSTLCTSIKVEASTLFLNSCWCVGSNNNVKFWSDTWNGDPLLLETSVDQLLLHGINPFVRIDEFSYNGQWNIPANWFLWFSFLNNRLCNRYPPSGNIDDCLYWKHNSTGFLN